MLAFGSYWIWLQLWAETLALRIPRETFTPPFPWPLLRGILFLLLAINGIKQLQSMPKQRLVQLFLIGGLGQALITYLSLHALQYIAVGPLAFLFYTYPAWVALLAALRRTERLTSLRAIALTLALVGVTIMVGAPSADKLNPIGVILALASALLY
jgi:drug/metabolite transporter (DMT)-like permease